MTRTRTLVLGAAIASGICALGCGTTSSSSDTACQSGAHTSICGPLEECGTLIATEAHACVSKSVAVPDSSSIDATETTFIQYQTWLASTPSYPPGGSSSVCSWKTLGYNAGCGNGNSPVACVDWCDAYAYCSAMGKRLCGKAGGGSNGFGDFANASLSQWYNACVSGGANNTYPYGSTYAPQACNGYDNGAGATVVVGSMPGCTSPEPAYAGVFDLSGNVFEWEDSCDGTSGHNDQCRLRGGSFGNMNTFLQCSSDSSNYRFYFYDNVGFRCCSNP